MRPILWIYGTDDFGIAVAEQVKELTKEMEPHRIVNESTLELALTKLQKEVTFVLISSRPRELLCLLVNARCCETGSAFLPIILETDKLLVGPLIQIPRSACWQCWSEREQANHVLASQRRVLLTSYNQESCKSPIGYMPYVVSLAAGKVASLINNRNLFDEHLGGAWAINLWTREVSQVRFVERHGCPHCGTRDEASTIGNLLAYCADLVATRGK